MNPYSGLFSEPLSAEAEAEFKKLQIVEELLDLMEQKGISRSELARRMEVSPSRITGMLTGANNFTIETLVRAGKAVGAELHQHLVPVGHHAHFSVCKSEDIHQAFLVNMQPTRLDTVAISLPSSATEDDAAAA